MVDRTQGSDAGFADQAEELKARALEYAGTARESFSKGNELVKEYLTNQPARALGIALGLGVAVGWLIKRR